MQQTRSVEMGTGLFVLRGLAALFFHKTQTTGSDTFSASETFKVGARFENIGSLKNRAPVALSGVTIGRVTSIRFDPEQLNAEVTFEIDNKYSMIPEDSDASILTAGLLGSQYVGLQPGGSEDYLQDGSEILFTQSAVVIENLISKYLFSQGSDSASKDIDK
jgi:phospholipid/cholesterol/gamma-HCH transport system substrate-binding protein